MFRLTAMFLSRLAVVFFVVVFFGNDSLIANESRLLDETEKETIFAFDQVSIPFTQNLRLEMQSPTRHPANPVLQRGPAGSPDAMGVQFYGSIIR